ncbi:efflux transporter outer membrane subunit [Qipengyuania sp. 1NDH17]|uniref:Efflux transporter outer membrane subunit n=1 Tax=Qipengyuania polymorpha TaxID=2867234 RepID=A0ABS7J238_9SPHN|nr:efflux transporter outer membrane subunit [Qipengyuania polymorpha]MBX7458395.1 efflux transporter outer membrane subunit [Qipengyuania polymorpha]
MRHSLLLASTLALAACAGGPPPEVATPTPVLPPTFYYAPDAAGETALTGLLPAEDPGFDALASQALANSPTLAEVLARIDQARAGANRAGAERLPNIGANASVTGQRTNPNQFGASLPTGVEFDTERVSYAANLTARWDPDIFGRLRAQERAAIARVDAADANSRAVRNALLAEIAASVIDWRTLEARQAAIEEDIAAAEELARLAGVREEAGIAPGFDRVRATSAANASRSRLAALESERARLTGRLVTLTAQGAAQVRAALALDPPAPALPAPPAALPSALLANRPDVLAAAATLAAEDAELAATARRRFPTFDLSAVIGLLAFSPADLFDEDSIVGSLAASVAGPLLDFGRVEAEIDGAAAEKQAAFQSYRGAVYTALGDAEAAYGLVAAADRELAAAAAEAASLRRAASLAETRQKAGLADFLTVLEARRAADASGERAAAALGRARRARVLLWQALGGEPQPTTRSMSQ